MCCIFNWEDSHSGSCKKWGEKKREIEIDRESSETTLTVQARGDWQRGRSESLSEQSVSLPGCWVGHEDPASFAHPLTKSPLLEQHMRRRERERAPGFKPFPGEKPGVVTDGVLYTNRNLLRLVWKNTGSQAACHVSRWWCRALSSSFCCECCHHLRTSCRQLFFCQYWKMSRNLRGEHMDTVDGKKRSGKDNQAFICTFLLFSITFCVVLYEWNKKFCTKGKEYVGFSCWLRSHTGLSHYIWTSIICVDIDHNEAYFRDLNAS